MKPRTKPTKSKEMPDMSQRYQGEPWDDPCDEPSILEQLETEYGIDPRLEPNKDWRS